jgi:hypothetical protein
MPSRTNVSTVIGRTNSTSKLASSHHVSLRCGDRGELDHLLQDPATNRREQSGQVDCDVGERHENERARQEVSLAANVRPWASESAE